MSVAVLLLWQFPRFWYSSRDAGSPKSGFERAPSTQLVAWQFTELPTSEPEAKLLVADRILSGEFRSEQGTGSVRVFWAARDLRRENETGLYIHTPDRCWLAAGWRLESLSPDLVEIELHGVRLPFERRIFVAGDQRELVYFTGTVEGRPLPYRLDHNISGAIRNSLQARDDRGLHWGSDRRFWHRILETFLSRTPMQGSKQFVRLSTSVERGDVEAADHRLQTFLLEWLDERKAVGR